MKVAYFMVACYIGSCMRVGTLPCKYFQLNSRYFNRDEGIFSKLDIDHLIPQRWRLKQYRDDGESIPGRFPVFVKPEWGQNAHGVERADSMDDLRRIRKLARNERINYLVQEAAPERQEYEIFSMRDHADRSRCSELTVTEARNDSEQNPVNSIYNSHTRYVDISDRFSPQQRETLWEFVREIGDFAISRVSVRADSVEDLLAGRFHVIEVNLFAPMPIHMLDPRYGWKDTLRFVKDYMMALARLTKNRDRELETKPVFSLTWFYNRRNPVVNFLRARL